MFKDKDFRFSQEALKKYFERIGVVGINPSEVTLANLSFIHRQQVISIHVGNYAMHDESNEGMDTPISVEINDIFNKLVLYGNHGYCFENNLLLAYALFSLGYKVRLVNAHIFWDDVSTEDPQHIVLLVSLNDKEYIVDAGYGGVAPIALIEFKVNVLQIGPVPYWTTTNEIANKYKLEKLEAEDASEWYKLSHYYQNPKDKTFSWMPLYQFQNINCTKEDIEQSNLRVAVNEETSPFMDLLFETSFDGQGGRKVLTQDKLLIIRHGQTCQVRKIESEVDYKAQLHDHFNHDESGPIRPRIKFG